MKWPAFFGFSGRNFEMAVIFGLSRWLSALDFLWFEIHTELAEDTRTEAAGTFDDSG
jgi:hypothetical protein